MAIEGNVLNLIIVIYDKPRPNIILNIEQLNVKIIQNQHSYLTIYWRAYLIKEGKMWINIYIFIRKEKVELPAFTYDIIYKEYSKESTENYKAISQFSKVAECKANVEKYFFCMLAMNNLKSKYECHLQ